jgi:hypothetical protein
MTTAKKWGGAGRGQGRKPVKDGEGTVTVSLRMTAAQRDKLKLLGGASWVRGHIDEADSSMKLIVVSENEGR